MDFFAAFLIGLAGSVHCFGMCGGIVSAFSLSFGRTSPPITYLLSYNLGRILVYSIIGALVGSLGYIFKYQFTFASTLLSLLSGLFLILLACYIGGWWRGLILLEKTGQYLWRWLSPLSQKILPIRSPLHAVAYGAIWGWLPCGLVYSTLSWSLSSGSGLNGALIMLSFGLGTLPSMLLTGMSADFLKSFSQSPVVKQIIAGILFTFGVFSIVTSLITF